MKHIVKQGEPPEFTDWKAIANEDWQPTYDTMPGDIKKAVNDALMSEQGYICCYCESRLIDKESHIEHFRPQSDPAVDALDFSNMLCSCQDRLKKGDPRHCGNLKEDWFDETLLVSPLDDGCEDRFIYTGDGRISPAAPDDHGAEQTIKRLGLNIPKLRDMRKKVIEPFLEGSLSTGEMTQFVSGYLQKDSQGMFGEFWTTIRYLFGGFATV